MTPSLCSFRSPPLALISMIKSVSFIQIYSADYFFILDQLECEHFTTISTDHKPWTLTAGSQIAFLFQLCKRSGARGKRKSHIRCTAEMCYFSRKEIYYSSIQLLPEWEGTFKWKDFHVVDPVITSTTKSTAFIKHYQHSTWPKYYFDDKLITKKVIIGE